MDKDLKCDIIIPIWNNLEFTRECVESVMRNTDRPYRLILVDNASDKETAVFLQGLAERPDVKLIRNDENRGFVKAANQGLRMSDAPFVCVLNNDIVAAPGWLGAMIDFAEEHHDIGLINPQCDGHGEQPIETYARTLAGFKGEYMEMNQCQGFCMLMRREVIDKIGYMDEEYGIGGFDDTDYSMRAHLAGYRCAAIRDAYVYHRQHASFNKSGDREEWVKRNEKIFYEKWGKPLRFLIPVTLRRDNWKGELRSALIFSYALAREWSWVHLAINFEKPLSIDKNAVGETLGAEKLSPHQNFKIVYSGVPKQLFYLTVVFRLLERMQPRKAKKRFDGIFSTSAEVLRYLTPFKRACRTELYRIDPRKTRDLLCDDARGLTGSIRGRNHGR